jgi:hypothetical protein
VEQEVRSEGLGFALPENLQTTVNAPRENKCDVFTDPSFVVYA